MAKEALDDDRYRAPALDKGLDILELLAGVDGGLTQAEIAKRMDRNANEHYRMLDRLVKRGYVTRIDGDRYALSLKLFGLAHMHAPVRRLVSYAMPLMRELAEKSRQANHLVVFDRGAAVVIAQQEAPGYWGLSLRLGAHIDMIDTGSGHILLAFRSPEERAVMLREHEDNGGRADKSPEFDAKLEAVRARGYEIMPSLQTASVTNLSVPVIGVDGRAIAALTTPYVPIRNAEAPDMEATIALLLETSQEISKAAGLEIG
ncbi:DNA-binding IclR family transcriptional regulator [Rhizobium sp. SG_E_25_P2]|uniref:IclR family transcriptional regulator n=1 Tax=Rhizobium sp. SG_E_25_P2 TaxID=2879942 RepID=UPI0024730E7D|nr:IclR family transcriptional regulator [Rhizobium sp. SG_E_25_P2]MDH6265757.1 DNA-binding IclR family transcriptional regulator [Rhizobium sp. SG_E_25_P2]